MRRDDSWNSLAATSNSFSYISPVVGTLLEERSLL